MQRGGAVMCWRVSAQACKAVDAWGIGATAWPRRISSCRPGKPTAPLTSGDGKGSLPSVNPAGILGGLGQPLGRELHADNRYEVAGIGEVSWKDAAFGNRFEIGGRLVQQSPSGFPAELDFRDTIRESEHEEFSSRWQHVAGMGGDRVGITLPTN